MAKRFTDSRKWDDGWFIELDPAYKLMWIYILDKCDHAGIYKTNPKLEICCLGFHLDLSADVFTDRIIALGDDKYFIPKFIDFQYQVSVDSLNESNRVHKSVLDVLTKEGACKGLVRGSQGCKDKDKDKDIINTINNDINIGDSFTKFWDSYPKKVGQAVAFQIFRATVKTDKDLTDLMTALKNYKESAEVKKGMIMNGGKWIEDWRGWLSMAKPKWRTTA